MRSKLIHGSAFAAMVVALFGAVGCPFAADLVNPSILTALGFDRDTIVRPSGSVLVAFVNNTTFSAEFYGYETADPDDLTVDTQTFRSLVGPGENSNEVLRCPTGAISLGIVGDNFTVTPTGAVVFTGGGQGAQGTPITYNGAQLVQGRDYFCGDVIEYTLNPGAGSDQNAAFAFTARVIPGR